MPRGSAPGERRGGRQKGTPNKATVARQNAQAESLAQATAAVMAGIDLSKFDGITGLAVMRLAMMAHLQANDLQAAAQWGEKVAPYETPKPVAKPLEPDNPDAPQGFVDGPPIAGSMDEWAQRAKTRTPSTSPDLKSSQESSQVSSTTSQDEAPGSSETPSESG